MIQTRTRSIIYWTATILIVFALLPGGIAESIHYKDNVDGIVKRLGYPMYFLNIQGAWKILGAIALLIPRFPLVKEWAYAGVMFNMTGAALSNAACGLGMAHIIAPLVIAGITVVSWIYRPSSRRLGNYFRNSSITPSATGG